MIYVSVSVCACERGGSKELEEMRVSEGVCACVCVYGVTHNGRVRVESDDVCAYWGGCWLGGDLQRIIGDLPVPTHHVGDISH